jgi:hypothetical protein
MLAAFFDTKARRRKGTKFFCFAQSSQRSKDAKDFFETQIHEVFLLKKVDNKWKILPAFPLGD